jgi:hypothetical protein
MCNANSVEIRSSISCGGYWTSLTSAFARATTSGRTCDASRNDCSRAWVRSCGKPVASEVEGVDGPRAMGWLVPESLTRPGLRFISIGLTHFWQAIVIQQKRQVLTLSARFLVTLAFIGVPAGWPIPGPPNPCLPGQGNENRSNHPSAIGKSPLSHLASNAGLLQSWMAGRHQRSHRPPK